MSKENSVKISVFGKCLFVFLFIGLALLCQPVFADTQTDSQNTPPDKKEAPLYVVSDKMIAKRDSSMVEFIGNVKATREDSILLADSVEVYFINDKKSKKAATQNPEKQEESQSNIKQIIATGNVEYTAGERKGYADKAVYTALDETLVLTGKAPKLVTGKSFVTGKKITWFRIQDTVIVESDGSKRVEALFNPEDKTTEKKQ